MKSLFTILLGSILLSSVHASATEHVAMYLKNASSTATTIEYDLFIENDGTLPFKLAGFQFGINFNAAILNGGTPTTTSYTYIGGTRDTVFALLTNYSTQYNNGQLKAASTPVSKANSVPLVFGTLYKLGRFRFTNTVPWTAGSVASLTFQLNQTPGKTHAIAVGYVDTSSTNSALTVANTFLTADASDVASLTLNVPLPVTLTSFEGVHLGASDILRWTTSEEKNNARFHLQHSNNGIEFKTIATLASNALQGNSSMPLEYSFTYNEPVSGHNYYRLIQEDLDGQKKQSGSILDLYRNTDKQVSVYPQPCFNSCMLRIGQEQECTMQMFIYSIEGKRLLEEQIHLYPGTQEVNVPVNHIQPGTYLLVLQQGSGTWYTSTLIKQ